MGNSQVQSTSNFCAQQLNVSAFVGNTVTETVSTETVQVQSTSNLCAQQLKGSAFVGNTVTETVSTETVGNNSAARQSTQVREPSSTFLLIFFFRGPLRLQKPYGLQGTEKEQE